MDEASMVANPDLADVISQAAATGAKVILAGDTHQLQAVQNGGLSLLAETLGYVRLAEPARFSQAGNRRPACGCATVTLRYLPSMTSTAGSSGETLSR
jgi:ATP-dependent exoDNAse (exonuclease V) alpha subunit